MTNINLYDNQPASSTSIPNIFIDEYMTQANGEYVKIFLYLIRCMNQSRCNFSLSQVADHFDHTEKDVLRALKYWENLSLLRLEYDAAKNLSGICLLHNKLPQEMAPSSSATLSDSSVTDSFIEAASTLTVKKYSQDDMAHFQEKEDICELIFITEQYLGRTLSQNDLNFIFFWYDQLRLPADLIEFIVENSVAKGHTSLHYMQKIAEDFANRSILTVEDAKTQLNRSTEVYHTVMKAFGIRGRNLVTGEIEYLNRWTTKMGFRTELIEEACRRTMTAIHEPSFEYTDSILNNWFKEHIQDMDGVRKSDETYQSSKKTKQRNTAQQPTPGSRFSNFQERENDYDELQKQLIHNSLDQG